MAQPVRKISQTPSRSVPANDNVSSLGRASLRLIQGQGSKQERDRNQPTLHPLSQMQLARELEESKSRDRAATGDSVLSDDALQPEEPDIESGGSVLDLEPQSYTTKDRTSEEAEVQRQRKLAQVAARFISPEKNSADSPQEAPSMERGSVVRRSSAAASEASPVEEDQQRAAMASVLLAQQRQEARARAVEEAEAKMEEVGRDAREVQSFYSLITKIIELESVILAIWVFIALNIETLNILILRVKAPDWINTMLAKIGLNLDVDPKRPFTTVNLLVVGVTLFVDLVITLYFLIQLALFLFVAYWIIRALKVLSYLGLSF